VFSAEVVAAHTAILFLAGAASVFAGFVLAAEGAGGVAVGAGSGAAGGTVGGVFTEVARQSLDDGGISDYGEVAESYIQGGVTGAAFGGALSLGGVALSRMLGQSRSGLPYIGTTRGNERRFLQSIAQERVHRVASSLGNNKRGPALSVVADRATLQRFITLNAESAPNNLTPALSGRVSAVAQSNPSHTWGVPGAHAEIRGLNLGLMVRPGAKPEDFGIFVVRAKPTKRIGETFPQCQNCTRITAGATAHSGTRPLGRTIKFLGRVIRF
jgi:hypothetical protein